MTINWLSMSYFGLPCDLPDTPLGQSSAGMTSPSLPNDDDVVLFLQAFDEAYTDASGDVRGGGLKVAYLAGKLLAKGLQFTKCPELDSLVTKLKKVFKV